MGIKSAEGVIIRCIDYGEADRIYTFYTLEYGKLSAIIKGIRKSRKRVPADILSRTHIIFSRKKPPYIINSFDLIDFHNSFYGNVGKTFFGMYFAELINRVSPEEEPNPSVYELLCFVMAQMDEGRIALDTLARIFETRLLGLSGYQPHLDGCLGCCRKVQKAKTYLFDLLKGGLICRECQSGSDMSGSIVRIAPGTVHFLRQAQRFELEKVSRLHLVQPLKKEVERLLQRYIQVQLEVNIRSYRFLKYSVSTNA